MKETKLKVGDKIQKNKGYQFIGTVVSVFETTTGEIRVVAENEDKMLHIFNEDQLSLRSDSSDIHVVKFSPYEVSNLKSMLGSTGYAQSWRNGVSSPFTLFNSGDWLGQIYNKLPDVNYPPNMKPEEYIERHNMLYKKIE